MPLSLLALVLQAAAPATQTQPAVPPPPVAARPATPEAQQLARRVAEAGDYQMIVAGVARAQAGELLRQHPELSPADRKALVATAQQRFLTYRSLLLDKLGEIYAGYFTVPELRAIAAFFDSAAGKRYGARLPATMPAIGAAFAKLDFKGEVFREFCAKTGKACPPAKPAPAPAR